MAHKHINELGNQYFFSEDTIKLLDKPTNEVCDILKSIFEFHNWKVVNINAIDTKKVWKIDIENNSINKQYSIKLFVASLRDANDGNRKDEEFKYAITTEESIHEEGYTSIQFGVYIMPNASTPHYVLCLHDIDKYDMHSSSNRRGMFIDGIQKAYVYGWYENNLCTIIRSDNIYIYLENIIKGKKSFNVNRNIIRPISLNLQQIYYGAPGTGKSFEVNRICTIHKHYRTTFHPDSDYSTFVGAYKPAIKKIRKCVIVDKEEKSIATAITNEPFDDKIIYKFVPQAFIQSYTEAWNDLSKPVFLIIEEINRGNCAQIFGDIFQLLDRKDNGYSSYEINPNEDIQQYLSDYFEENGIDSQASADIKSGNKMCLPPNLYIWATMNTSDQSLFPIDSAFKRRWDWKYVPIADAGKGYKIETETALYDWWDFLQKVNEAVNEVTNSEDKKLGYFFCKGDKQGRISADKFVSKVMFYLYSDVLKDSDGDDVAFMFEDKQYTLLKWKEGDKEGHFKFPMFFDQKGDAKADMVDKFLQNIEVKSGYKNDTPKSENGATESTEGSSNYNGTEKNFYLSVTLNGERIYAEDNYVELYLETLRRIGLERIEELNILYYGDPMVSKTKQNQLNRPIGNTGYYAVTKSLSLNVKDKLSELKRRLNLDLEFEFSDNR